MTPLGRALMTRGMIGCFLSHRAAWQRCVQSGKPLLILEDDVCPAAGFASKLCAALAELPTLDPNWDVLLVGALGCIHPRHRYGMHLIVGAAAGGLRYPRVLSAAISIPLRPMGTHAYVLSPAGARTLLALCPRANFHVDVAAWGETSLRLYLASDSTDNSLLALQAPADANGGSTIGGVPRSAWLPTFTVDAYTGAEFGWAFNGPVLQVAGVVLTIGRSLVSTALLFAIAAASASGTVWCMAVAWFAIQLLLIQALKVTRWTPARLLTFLILIGVGIMVIGLSATEASTALASPSHMRLMAGPVVVGSGRAPGYAVLERPSAQGLPRLKVVGGRVFDEAAIVSLYTFSGRVLGLRRPFTCLWDPRSVQWPKLTPSMFRTIRAWVDVNAKTWDTHVQAHAILLTNPIVRSITKLVIRLFAPPQPIRIVASEAEALEFHSTCCRKPRSWVKPSYADRDQRFALANNLFGVTGAGGGTSQRAEANAKPAKANAKRARQSKSAKATAVESSCSLVPPSGRAWARAFATQLCLMVCGMAPIATLLFYTRHTRRTRQVTSTLVALCAAAAVPIAVAYGRRHDSTNVTWTVAFLGATFGFATFFKCLTVALGAHPKGADTSLANWLHWMTSLPEPLFEDGKPVRRPTGQLTHRACLLGVKLVALGAVLSVVMSWADADVTPAVVIASSRLSGRGQPPSPPLLTPPPLLNGWPMHLLRAELHLWIIYLFASLCLDIGSLLVLLSGHTIDLPFHNPLLASRSLGETWGSRWNRPVHEMLKRTVYKPARACGLSSRNAALATFLASGLLHEYNFAVHNQPAYVFGEGLVFFTLMGLMGVAEGQVARRLPPRWSALLARAPAPLPALGLQLMVLPAFERFFVRSWLEAGMVEAVAELVPHVLCG